MSIKIKLCDVCMNYESTIDRTSIQICLLKYVKNMSMISEPTHCVTPFRAKGGFCASGHGSLQVDAVLGLSGPLISWGKPWENP